MIWLRGGGVLVGLLVGVTSLSAQAFDHQHAGWTRLLERHVEVDGGVGSVDYDGLAAERPALERYLAALSSVTPDEFAAFSADERLAFLINAYNAFTVQLVLDHQPIDSIKDIGGWFRSPWKRRFFELLGGERHLDDVEHGMIRPWFQEPRIHFAVNCAAVSCPPLQPEAYVADRLDTQLERATRRFLRDARRTRFDGSRGRLELSAVMDWYRDDFERDGDTLGAFVAARIAGGADEGRAIAEAHIRFLDYDWDLNGRRSPR